MDDSQRRAGSGEVGRRTGRREFLEEKCESADVLAQRWSLIEAWVAKHPRRNGQRSKELEEALQEAEPIVEEFHIACIRLREAVKAN